MDKCCCSPRMAMHAGRIRLFGWLPESPCDIDWLHLLLRSCAIQARIMNQDSGDCMSAGAEAAVTRRLRTFAHLIQKQRLPGQSVTPAGSGVSGCLQGPSGCAGRGARPHVLPLQAMCPPRPQERQCVSRMHAHAFSTPPQYPAFVQSS